MSNFTVLSVLCVKYPIFQLSEVETDLMALKWLLDPVIQYLCHYVVLTSEIIVHILSGFLIALYLDDNCKSIFYIFTRFGIQ